MSGAANELKGAHRAAVAGSTSDRLEAKRFRRRIVEALPKD
jgi:hypothetical protein